MKKIVEGVVVREENWLEKWSHDKIDKVNESKKPNKKRLNFCLVSNSLWHQKMNLIRHIKLSEEKKSWLMCFSLNLKAVNKREI